jgi:F-type H+-transporting ATPase subunit b
MVHLLLAAEETATKASVVSFWWMPYVTSLVVFAIVFFLLAKMVWPKIVGGLEDRENKIRDEIRSAEEAREEAKKAQAEYQRELEQARQEAAEMINKAKADAKAVADDLRSRNEQELAEMKERATRDIQSAKQSAISELHAEAATLASAIAAKILQREISVEDQQRLVDESLRELGRTKAN